MTATINASTSSGVVTTADNSGVLQLQTASTAALTIDSSQNVGIGTASPSYKLDITGQGRATTGFAVSTDGSTFTPAGLNAIPNYGVGYITSTSQTVLSGFGGIPFYTNQLERMRIDSSGNVGIGTSSPATELQLYKNKSGDTTKLNITNPNDTGGVLIQMNAQTTSPYQGVFGVANAGGYMQIGMISSHPIQFITNNAERMRIDSSGNLLVGTTTNNGVITSYTSSASGRAGFFMVNAASSLAFDAVGISKFDNNTTTSQVFVKFFINNNTAASGLITASGANQAAFTSSSDLRLKENIVDLPSQLDNIMGLRPVEFDYIESEGGGHQIGFIAQEVKKIYPDLVGIREDGMFLVSDLNKNDARLIKAIQEQQALIKALTDRITALEGK